MSDEFIGKTVLVSYTKQVKTELTGEVVSDYPEGVTIRHAYRKGKRLEFIPRDKIESVFFDEEKKARKSKPTKEGVTEPTATKTTPQAKKPVVKKEPIVKEEDLGIDETLSNSAEFDDGDDFEDDEFE